MLARNAARAPDETGRSRDAASSSTVDARLAQALGEPRRRPAIAASCSRSALDRLELVVAAADQPERLAGRRASTTDSYRSARSSRTWYGPRIA